MAQETAVHRVDVESAFEATTPVDAELAVDGVDEVLVMMLGGDWTGYEEPDLVGTVAVSTGGRTWYVAMTPAAVTVAESPGEAAVVVRGEPSDVLLWLWGRAPDDVVTFDGDLDAARRFRQRLAVATQ
jgi:hypothetical protein